MGCGNFTFPATAARIGIPVEKLLTHRLPLDQISEVFQRNLREEGIKIVVEAR
jgi:L-iditol 2-dehydrogenase